MPRSYIMKATPELQEGDVVNAHGLRCKIDRPLTLSQSHPGGQTFYVQALVLNRDDVPNEVVPVSWTRDWQGPSHRPAENGEHRWTIQGNELARWAVETL